MSVVIDIGLQDGLIIELDTRLEVVTASLEFVDRLLVDNLRVFDLDAESLEARDQRSQQREEIACSISALGPCSWWVKVIFNDQRLGRCCPKISLSELLGAR